MENPENMRRKQLGQFLQAKRRSLSPASYGFYSKNRKTPGLRREEVSLLVDVSVDWYAWLEQGRDIHVSARVLDNISNVFHLTASERKHLFLLAQQSIPADIPHEIEKIPAIVQDFLNHQNTSPSYVTNLKWDIIAWNQAACAVFGDYNKMSNIYCNSIWRAFNSHYMKNLLDDWDTHAKKRVAQFRASYSLLYEDSWWNDMLNELIVNEDFKKWWDLYNIEDSPSGAKLLHHPSAGDLLFDHLSCRWCDDPNLLITVHMPSDQSTLLKMKKLLSEVDLEYK